MNLTYPGLLTFVILAIATLLFSVSLDRWWRERSYNQNGKTVLLTGGSRELGLVMARQLVQAKARVALKLHFWAPLYTSYAVLPEMRQRKAGRIVNISSISGKIVSPHMVAYCASKFALTGLSEGMQTELASAGIAVTTVCPGFIHTGVINHAIMKATVNGTSSAELSP